MSRLQSFDIHSINLQGFAKELEELKKEELKNIGPKDLRHLKKIDLITRFLFWVGIITSVWIINPLSAFLISLGKTGRWTMMAHHVSHGGYDKIESVPTRYTSKSFARGSRRWLDWLDWMHPAAWHLEHNILHHYHTSEQLDPDFVQKNTARLRNSTKPVWLKYLIAIFLASHWKISYYAPNTWWYYWQKKTSNKQLNKSIELESKKDQGFPGSRIYSPFHAIGFAFWKECLLPYIFFNFILLPTLFLPFGIQYSLVLLINLLIAEIFTNWHSFLIIVTNHSGEDLPFFDSPIKSKSEFYIRQIIGSVNFHGGHAWSDFLQGYLNYQIEHHLWPDLPMTSYRRLQPRVEALCNRYRIPYLKENVFIRARKMMSLMVGRTNMQLVLTR